MTDTTTPAELEIPPAAVDEYFVCGCSESGIRAGYKPDALAVVVAAELRRFINRSIAAAGKVGDADPGWQAGVSDTLTRLGARADELDGGMP